MAKLPEDGLEAERADITEVHAQIKALQQRLISAKRPAMIIYLLEMTLWECMDVIQQQGHYAPGKRY